MFEREAKTIYIQPTFPKLLRKVLRPFLFSFIFYIWEWGHGSSYFLFYLLFKTESHNLFNYFTNQLFER
jgi:hypothetical protein